MLARPDAMAPTTRAEILVRDSTVGAEIPRSLQRSLPRRPFITPRTPGGPYYVKAMTPGDEGDKTMSTFGYSQSQRRDLIDRAAAAIVGHVSGALQAMRNWHEAQLAIRHLNSVSDYLLKDIGVHRGQIEFVVRGLEV